MKRFIAILSAVIIVLSLFTGFGISANAASYQEVSGQYHYSYAAEVLRLVNEERERYQLKPLTMTASLTDGAMLRAAETVVSFSHTRPNGEQCFTAFTWSGSAGENIAYGQRSPSEVVTAWMNSSGHRANILNSRFTTVGMGCFVYRGVLYWAQAFSGGTGTAYAPSGTKDVTVQVSLTAGTASKVITGSTAQESTTVPTTRQTTTAPSTTRQTTTRQTTTRQTTTRQTATRPSTTTQPQTTQPKTTAAPSTTAPPATSSASTTCRGSCSATQSSARERLTQLLNRLYRFFF